MNDVNLKFKVYIKNNILLKLIKETGLNISQFSREIGLLSPETLYNILSVKNLKPSSLNGKLAKKIANYFNVPIEYFITPELLETSKKINGIKTEAEIEIESVKLLANGQKTLLLEEGNPETLIMEKEKKEEIRKAINRLPKRERDILSFRFGFEDGKAKTLQEASREFCVTTTRIMQLESKALKRLRLAPTYKRFREYITIN